MHNDFNGLLLQGLNVNSALKISEEEYKNLSEYNFDHPNAFDFDLITEHLRDLLNGKEVQMPVYNFTTSKRESYCQTVKPGNMIIFEGILALYDKVN